MLRLTAQRDGAPHLPIDMFFRSLARDQYERAVCIVLSGTGTDGVLGLQEIKAQGGMVLVQEPTSAKYTGMPSGAVDTGLVDAVVAPAEMPKRLRAYTKGLYLRKPAHRPPDSELTD